MSTEIQIKAQDLKVGWDFWEGPGWSSHGIKSGFWDAFKYQDDLESFIAEDPDRILKVRFAFLPSAARARLEVK